MNRSNPKTKPANSINQNHVGSELGADGRLLFGASHDTTKINVVITVATGRADPKRALVSVNHFITPSMVNARIQREHWRRAVAAMWRFGTKTG